jgi:flagellar motility protein MotE (MotC chaperone)
MNRSLPGPRLLPMTIFAMAALLGVKCAGLIGAASAESQAAPAPARHDPSSRPLPQGEGELLASRTKDTPSPCGRGPGGGDERHGGGDEAHAAKCPSPSAPSAPPLPAVTSSAHQADLNARDTALRERQSVLVAAEQKLEQRVAELKALQAKLESLQSQWTAQQDQHWEGLVQLYEKMKPRDAARILEGMDVPVVVSLIDRMKQVRAAPILAAMQPERARDITAELAARHGQPPTPQPN